jgi:hypothetical protein
VKACVLLDADGRIRAVNEAHADDGEELAELTRELLDRADTAQVEVSTGSGIVYGLRSGEWTLAVVTGRYALSSLVFFDMRRVVEEIGG